MTSAKTLSGKYSSLPFFRFTFRQNLQHLALYLVIVILAMFIPTVVTVQDFYERYDDYYVDHLVAEDATMTIGVIGLFVAGGLAVLSGMSASAYVNSKPNTGCYHSFPIRREKIFLLEGLTRLLYFLISMLVGYTASFMLLVSALPASQKVMTYLPAYGKLAFSALIVYLLVYSVFLFASSITGTAPVRFLMVLVIFIAPVALYWLILNMFVTGCSSLDGDYYFNQTTGMLLFSPYRVVVGITELLEENKWGILLTALIDTALFTGAGVYLHTKRKSEAAGTSIIWKPVMLAVQIVVIVGCTLFSTIMFESFFGMETGQGIFFGGLIGAVLSFIVSNCILYRSSRAMFRGLKGFGILCAVMAVFFLLVPLNALGLVGNFYSAGNTAELIVTPVGMNTSITFTDREEIEELLALMTDDGGRYSNIQYYEMPYLVDDPADPYANVDTKYRWDLVKEEYGDDYETYYEVNVEDGSVTEVEYKMVVGREKGTYSPRSGSVLVVQKPWVGLPLAIYVYTDVKSSLSETLYESRQFIDFMNVSDWIDKDSIAYVNITLDERGVRMSGTQDFYHYDGFYDSSKVVEPDMWDTLLSVVDAYSYDPAYRNNSTVVGYIDIAYKVKSGSAFTMYERESVYLPIYADQLSLINTVAEILYKAEGELGYHRYTGFEPYETVQDYFRAAEVQFTDNQFILLVNLKTGEKRELTTEEFVALSDKTAVFLSGDTWDLRCVINNAQSSYGILYQRADNIDIEVNFREGAITDEELAEIFAK